MRTRLPLTLLVAVALAAVGRALLVAPTLPERVASHFALDGAADGWTSRTSLFVLGAVLLAFLVALFAGLPALVRVLPTSLINLPHREQWLAPQHREATLESLSARMAWMGVATLAFFAALFEGIYAANRAPESARLPGTTWILVTAYLVFTGLWVLGLWLRFRRVPS
jgi:uncharacterized membrane protein